MYSANVALSNDSLALNTNSTATYADVLLAADLDAIFGHQPTMDAVVSFTYGFLFPVVATIAIVSSLTIASFFLCVPRFRSHETGSMASLFVGSQLVADCLFLVCIVLTTTPAAVVFQQQQVIKVDNGSLQLGTNSTIQTASGSSAGAISVAQTLFIRTK